MVVEPPVVLLLPILPVLPAAADAAPVAAQVHVVGGHSHVRAALIGDGTTIAQRGQEGGAVLTWLLGEEKRRRKS